jgi:hypothetical protein
MQTEPSALADIHAYVRNILYWLAPVPNRIIAANLDDNLRSEIILMPDSKPAIELAPSNNKVLTTNNNLKA